MQGRLSPPQDNRFQFFPDDWRVEFRIAKDLGFDLIEWFVDFREDGSNSVGLWADSSTREQIGEVSKIVPVVSADCGRLGLSGKSFSEKLFKDFISSASGKIKTFNIPLLEEASIKNESVRKEALENIKFVLEYADKFDVRIGLEADLRAEELLDFINKVNSPRIGVCYDIGNCTSYGFNCPDEIRILGDKIFEVHLKDRRVGADQSMLLGTGNADFTGCFLALKDIGYNSNYVLQAWRGKDYLSDAQKQLAFAKEKLNNIYQNV